MFGSIKKIYKGYNNKDKLNVYINYFFMLIINRFLPMSYSGKSKVFGNTFIYSSRSSFYGMFNEVFVEQNYHIEPTKKKLQIIDCGTNIGMSLLYFRRQAPNSIIIAFEPNPYTFKIVKENVLTNKLDVGLHNIGLGLESAEVDFYTDINDLSSQSASVTRHLATKNYDLISFKVNIKKLSDYIDRPIDILKLDIEGSEGEVLEDISITGKINLINKIFIEYHYDGVHTIYPLGKILSVLDESGFIYAISSGVSLPYVITDRQSFSYKIIAWKKMVSNI